MLIRELKAPCLSIFAASMPGCSDAVGIVVLLCVYFSTNSFYIKLKNIIYYIVMNSQFQLVYQNLMI